MRYFASCEEIKEDDSAVYNIVRGKQVQIGLNRFNGDEITLHEYMKNPLQNVMILDLPEEMISLYSMTTLDGHKTHDKDKFTHELVVPFIEKKYIVKTIKLSDDQYNLLAKSNCKVEYIVDRYYIFKKIEWFLDKNCVDWITCCSGNFSALYDLLTCIDEIPETTKLTKKIKVELRKKIAGMIIEVEDHVEDTGYCFDSLQIELSELNDIWKIITEYTDDIREEQCKLILKV